MRSNHQHMTKKERDTASASMLGTENVCWFAMTAGLSILHIGLVCAPLYMHHCGPIVFRGYQHKW